MKAYEIGTQEGLASLRLVERPDLVAGPGEVVLRVSATCLNHRDMLVLSGSYGPRRAEERVPCSDGVGTVIALGKGVGGISIGERATANHFVSWTGGAFSQSAFGADLGINRDGWLAEQIVVPAAALVRLPDSIDDARSAPLPAAGLTAWNALVEVGRIKAGDLVLTLGTGGVSIFALQIARMHGARVAVTSSSDEKLAIARDLGADITINYRTNPDWSAALLDASGGTGADLVVETGGMATLQQSIAAAAVNGRIVIIGALAGPPSQGLSNFPSIIGKNLTLRGIAEGSRAMLEAMVRAVDVSGLRPVIDREFAFDQAAQAFAHLKSGEHLGKVMIRM